jgi:uncharacterized phage protein (TIGR01671 family)
MREILFRGKRVDDGKWWEGYLTVVFQHTYIEKADENEAFRFVVDPETVGQFTGLTDKNGKKIFEGDILKFHKFKGEPDWTGFVKYDISMFVIEGEQPVDNGGFEVQLCSIDRKRCEIVGNIHDNPELLEG